MSTDSNDPILQNILKNSRSYEEGLYEDLQDPEEAQAYLESAIEAYEEDGDTECLLLALRDVTNAQGITGNLEKQFDNLSEIFSGLSFHLRFERKNVVVEPQKIHA